jgi:shikimate dehydrogenase
MPARRRLAVLGSPIGHSRSPELHRAAYDVLGFDWEYGRAEVPAGGLAGFLAGLGDDWRGLSLTMPLKREVAALVPDLDDVAVRSGQANTIVLGDDGARAFNTDVAGIVDALADAGVTRPACAVVLGAGATAESAVIAARELGAAVTVAARSPEKAAGARAFGEATAVHLADAPLADADVVISTVPGGVDLGLDIPALRPEQALLDVVYHPWPTPLAASWRSRGGAIVDGLGMLLHQAVRQIRIFAHGDPAVPLPREDAVILAMRDAVRRS